MDCHLIAIHKRILAQEQVEIHLKLRTKRLVRDFILLCQVLIPCAYRSIAKHHLQSVAALFADVIRHLHRHNDTLPELLCCRERREGDIGHRTEHKEHQTDAYGRDYIGAHNLASQLLTH